MLVLMMKNILVSSDIRKLKKGSQIRRMTLTVEFMETIWYQDLLSIYQCFLQKYLRNKGGYNK